MIKSMTGFGTSESNNFGWNIRVEIKAVNHRYGEVVVRIPKQFSILEEGIRAAVLKKIVRGRVEVFLNFEETEEKKSIVKLDKDLALAYHQNLKELSNLLAQEYRADAFQLAQLPDVLAVKAEKIDLEAVKVIVGQIVDVALAKLLSMRKDEGQELTKDLTRRLDNLQEIANKINERSPLVVKEYQQKIRERIGELLKQVPVDENRLAMEIAIIADKANIDEELVRVNSHFQQFRQTLNTREAVGRKLDFLVQEMNREVNTIGSKAGDLTISHLVVEAKSELEKIREQVQNIE